MRSCVCACVCVCVSVCVCVYATYIQMIFISHVPHLVEFHLRQSTALFHLYSNCNMASHPVSYCILIRFIILVINLKDNIKLH